MPRNRPARLRALAALSLTTPIPGVPMSTSHVLDRLGRPDISSREIALALKRWRHIGALPESRLDSDHSDHTVIEAPMFRGQLERAIRALPRRHAAALRHAVAPADRQFEAKTIHDPYSDPGRPWWERRCRH